MTDKPTQTNHGSNSADPDEEGVVIDETEAGFLEDRAADEYPSVLQITSESGEKHRKDALDRLDRWEAGEDVPHVINFQNPSDLRALLTDRRVELLRSIMAAKPDSIRQLASRLDRDVKTVHDDLGVLAEYDIIHYEQDGRAKRPFVPYDSIEVSLEISTPQPADDTISA
ncbi:transcriptional regulator [Halobacteriaceae bacterium SHR40]|uniref:HVO_A0114 family putative DNA-binding protein n=1 Tax=Halovenus amylolytica TaxID=2500550 RepID=UPI000FE41613